MKVVILAGGLGTRISEESYLKPKPMIEIGGKPILWHIMKSIWNSDAMNALRLQHLDGRRKQNQVCGNCGQLSHCLPDNIDAHRPMLLEKFKSRVVIDSNLEPPGGSNRRFAAVAAE